MRRVVASPAVGWIEAGIVALAAVLVFFSIGEKGFWFDETLSVERASRAWSGLWQDITTSQANMGLYYVALHGWIAIGDSEAVVRALSACFAIVSVPVLFGLTSRLFGTTAGVTASLLLTVNSFFISYAQEARGYSLALLLATSATWAFVAAVERPTWRAWAVYVVCASAALYAHFFCALVLAVHGLSVALIERRRTPWRGLAAAAVAIGIAGAPLLYFVLFRDVGQIDWVTRPRAADLYDWFARFAGGGWALAAVAAIAVAAALVAVLRTPAASGDGFGRWRIGLIVCWFLVPPALAVLASFAKPVFQPRYLIVALPPLVMLVAVGLTRLRPRAAFAAALSLVIVLSAVQVRAWYAAPDRQWWRAAVDHVARHATGGDAITFFVYSARVPFEYYAARSTLAGVPVDYVDLAAGWIAGNVQPDPAPERVRALAGTHSRVWLIRLQDGTPPGHPLRRYEQVRSIETALADGGAALHRTHTFPGGIRVQEWRSATMTSSFRRDTALSRSNAAR